MSLQNGLDSPNGTSTASSAKAASSSAQAASHEGARAEDNGNAVTGSNGNAMAGGENPLERWRQQIDALDLELLRLLNRRAAIACEIARVKVAAGIPAYDARREAQVLEKVTTQNPGPFDDESVRAIFHSIVHETRCLGTKRMEEEAIGK
jgi:chorismate mutase